MKNYDSLRITHIARGKTTSQLEKSTFDNARKTGWRTIRDGKEIMNAEIEWLSDRCRAI